MPSIFTKIIKDEIPSFKIHENDKIAKKQFGNSVPTNVVYYLTKEILSNLIF